MAFSPDTELWHDYLRQLIQFFPGFDKDNGDRMYAAPLTSMGISIGQSIDFSYINNDLFRIGDLLLPPESPIFIPGASYSARLLRYLDSVQVPPGKQDAASLQALEEANKTMTRETNDFLTCRREAAAAYNQDPERNSMSFDAWVEKYYPPYQLAQTQKDAATQAACQATQDYYGTQTSELWQDKVMVGKAFGTQPNPPFNMPTRLGQVSDDQILKPGPSDASANPPPSADIKYEPRYNIDSTFLNLVQTWVKIPFDTHNQPFDINFHSTKTSPSNGSKWGNGPAPGPPAGPAAFNDIGFTKVSFDEDTVAPILPLLTITLPDQPAHAGDVMMNSFASGIISSNAANTRMMVGGDRQNCSISINMHAPASQVFAINPDASWNIPDVAAKYNLRPDASNDLYEPQVLVRYVLLGYMVSLTITTDKQSFSDLDAGLSRAESIGAKATLFGLDVGPQSTDNVLGYQQIERSHETSTIKIPPRNNAQLTLIGLVGRKLKTPVKTN